MKIARQCEESEHTPLPVQVCDLCAPDYLSTKDPTCCKHGVKVKCGIRCDGGESCSHENENDEFILKPISFSLLFVNNPEQTVHSEYFYYGENAAEKFIDLLIEKEEELLDVMTTYREMTPLTEEEEEMFASTDLCGKCFKPFTEENWKVRHHDHFTGSFEGVICNKCNLAIRRLTRIKLFAHNSNGFDSHLLIQVMSKSKLDSRKFTVIPNNYQSFKGMTFESFDILDSLAFLPSKLSKLVDSLISTKKSSGEILQLVGSSDLVQKSDGFSQKKYDMLLKKGVFPYDAFQNMEYLQMNKFPPKEDFFNCLRDENITDEEYLDGQKCFEEFKCQTMYDYLKLYNRLDVYLLAEIFSQFMIAAYESFQLDVTAYWTLPSFAYGKKKSIVCYKYVMNE